jgi:hypothetical protein
MPNIMNNVRHLCLFKRETRTYPLRCFEMLEMLPLWLKPEFLAILQTTCEL